MSSKFDKLDERTVYDGHVVDIKVARFRHEDGEVVTREWADHPGAVAVVAHDGERIYMVRQPREAIMVPDLLELPAGKLDEPDESPLECARRELAEEIGKAADTWEHLTSFYTSAGFADEIIHLYLATGLRDEPGKAIESERIDVEAHPLGELDQLIASNQDAKTIIGLAMLRERLRTPPA